MRIVNAKPSREVVRRVICRNCGVEIEYVPADTREQKQTDFTGGVDFVKVINCPGCTKQITVS